MQDRLVDKRQWHFTIIDDAVHDMLFAGEITMAEFTVYVSIARFANQHGSAFPSIETLRKGIGVKRHTVIDAIKKLESVGLLSCERRPGKATVYSLLPTSAPRDTTQDQTSAPRDTTTSAPRDTRTILSELEDDDDNARAREEATAMLSDTLTWGHWVPFVPMLHDYADEMGWAVVLIAMQRTLEHSHSRSWAYAKRILDEWSRRKVRSPTDVAKLDQQFEASKQKNRGRAVPNEPIAHPAHQPLLAPEGYKP